MEDSDLAFSPSCSTGLVPALELLQVLSVHTQLFCLSLV